MQSFTIPFKIPKKWKLIDTNQGSAAYNMAVDETLLSNFEESDLPILRLYRWESSLSLGRFSNPHNSLDLQSIKKQKLSFVRRMTGGGILLHGGDLSYSLLLPRTILKNVSVKESYRYLCQFLITLYDMLGVKAMFASDLNMQSSKSAICMSANEPYDIIINGRKIGGNAQRYTKQTLFQHGSIPITFDEKAYKDVFLEGLHWEEILSLDKIGSVSTDERIKELLVNAFTETFDVEIIRDVLDPYQAETVNELMEKKYTQSSWNSDAKQYSS